MRGKERNLNYTKDRTMNLIIQFNDNAGKLVSTGTVIRIESISSFHPLQSEEEVRGEFIEAWVIMTMSGTFTPNKQM